MVPFLRILEKINIMKKIFILSLGILFSVCMFGRVSVEGSFDVLDDTQQTSLGVLFDYSQAKVDDVSVSLYAKRQGMDWKSFSTTLESRFIQGVNEEEDQCLMVPYSSDNFTYYVKVSFFTIDEDGECTVAIRLLDTNNADTILALIELSADSQRGDWNEAMEDTFKDLGEEFGKFLDKQVF